MEQVTRVRRSVLSEEEVNEVILTIKLLTIHIREDWEEAL